MTLCARRRYSLLEPFASAALASLCLALGHSSWAQVLARPRVFAGGDAVPEVRAAPEAATHRALLCQALDLPYRAPFLAHRKQASTNTTTVVSSATSWAWSAAGTPQTCWCGAAQWHWHAHAARKRAEARRAIIMHGERHPSRGLAGPGAPRSAQHGFVAAPEQLQLQRRPGACASTHAATMP